MDGRRPRRACGRDALVARVVFMGTPEYAVPALEVVLARAEAVLVVTRADAPAGRGRQLRPSPVRARAEASGVRVLAPPGWDATTADAVAAFRPDFLLTAAYGVILPASALAQARLGAFNLHASLLPRWRGANPIAWAVRAGDPVTGVSLMQMDTGVDTGPVVATLSIPIADEDTTGRLTEKLGRAAADLLDAQWERLARGEARPRPQAGPPSRARRFRPEEARIDWTEAAPVVWRRVRSMLPSPGPYTTVDGHRITILSCRPRPESVPPGTIEIEGDKWIIGCGTGSLEVSSVKPAGGRPMEPEAFRRGRPHLRLQVE
jgi:methionyl-tRNA formyltransferase